MAQWKERLPGYEFVEWNEQNFDFTAYPYAAQAYQVGKYAFVSDVARLFALDQMGGIYLDTDVEVLRPFDPLLNRGVVLGFELDGYVAKFR